MHGNLPKKEKDVWVNWMMWKLKGYAKSCGRNWGAKCVHLERVKSFAPNVEHYVADILLGLGQNIEEEEEEKEGYIQIPSCALEGTVLTQDWMK